MIDIYEKFKSDDYKYYTDYHTQIENFNISGINIKVFEMSEKSPFRENIAYTQYCNDNSYIVGTATEYKDFVLDFIKEYSADMFSSQAFDCAYAYLKNIKSNMEKRCNYTVMYGINDKRKLSVLKRQATSIKFDEKIKYDIIEDSVYVDRVRPGIYYGTLIDEKIVSVASWNEYSKSSEIIGGKKKDTVDIGIGTHKEYRRKGYGVSNVVSLAEYILNIQHIECVIYHTDDDNINSQRTAESAGFVRVTNSKNFW